MVGWTQQEVMVAFGNSAVCVMVGLEDLVLWSLSFHWCFQSLCMKRAESCHGNHRENPKKVKFKGEKVQWTCAELGQGPEHIKCAAGQVFFLQDFTV